jgi:uncharacterized protein (DUF1810 family)
MNSNLDRFIEAQENQFNIALSEIKNGKKISHWMWYIFPQLAGLGSSNTAAYYAINNLDEAKHFLNNELLGSRLFTITKVLFELEQNNAEIIFGYPDDLKLKSSMTLFYIASDYNEIFKSIIDKYYNGDFCKKTIQLLTQN